MNIQITKKTIIGIVIGALALIVIVLGIALVNCKDNNKPSTGVKELDAVLNLPPEEIERVMKEVVK